MNGVNVLVKFINFNVCNVKLICFCLVNLIGKFDVWLNLWLIVNFVLGFFNYFCFIFCKDVWFFLGIIELIMVFKFKNGLFNLGNNRLGMILFFINLNV